MKLTEKEKDQIVKRWAEAMSKIIERMSIEMWELEEENKNLTKCNLNLQEWLDNKEKVNKSIREENKNLKSDLAYERTMLDNVRAEYESLQNVNKKLKEELSKYEKQYQHSMWFSDFWGYDLNNNK